MQRMQCEYKRLVAFVGFMLCLPLWLPTADAQQPSRDKTAYAFQATVEKVDTNAKKLTVNKIDAKLKTATGITGQGWSLAEAQTYGVDKPEVLDRVKAGDRITATMYEGDLQMLFDVQVAPAAKSTADSTQR